VREAKENWAEMCRLGGLFYPPEPKICDLTYLPPREPSSVADSRPATTTGPPRFFLRRPPSLINQDATKSGALEETCW